MCGSGGGKGGGREEKFEADRCLCTMHDPPPPPSTHTHTCTSLPLMRPASLSTSSAWWRVTTLRASHELRAYLRGGEGERDEVEHQQRLVAGDHLEGLP